MSFGDKLKSLRTRRSVSQVELATYLHISKSAVSMYERGERTPDFETLEGIADFFNVSIDYLLDRENGSMYYLDPEVAEIANEMSSRPELKALMDASRKLTKEDLEDLEKIVNKFYKE